MSKDGYNTELDEKMTCKQGSEHSYLSFFACEVYSQEKYAT
jgi:hypothetical protein